MSSFKDLANLMILLIFAWLMKWGSVHDGSLPPLGNFSSHKRGNRASLTHIV